MPQHVAIVTTKDGTAAAVLATILGITYLVARAKGWHDLDDRTRAELYELTPKPMRRTYQNNHKGDTKELYKIMCDVHHERGQLSILGRLGYPEDNFKVLATLLGVRPNSDKIAFRLEFANKVRDAIARGMTARRCRTLWVFDFTEVEL